jgi:hypothetical protein
MNNLSSLVLCLVIICCQMLILEIVFDNSLGKYVHDLMYVQLFQLFLQVNNAESLNNFSVALHRVYVDLSSCCYVLILFYTWILIQRFLTKKNSRILIQCCYQY